MAKVSSVQRTLRWLVEEEGYPREHIEKTEHWNSFSKRRHDLYNLFDYVVLDFPHGILGVQCCTRGDFAAHERKMEANPILDLWLRQNRALLVGWGKVKRVRGGKQMVYRARTRWWEEACQ